MIQETIARLAYLRDYCFLGTRFESFGRRDEDGHTLPFSLDPEGFAPHLTDMEIMLHRTQMSLDSAREELIVCAAENHFLATELDELRSEFHVTSEENGALAQQLFALREEHEAITARNRAFSSPLRTTRLARDRLVKKVEGVQTINAILRGRLTTCREELATKDSTIDELEARGGEHRSPQGE